LIQLFLEMWSCKRFAGLASNRKPLDLSLPSSKDYRYEPLVSGSFLVFDDLDSFEGYWSGVL
jgi:hypothetical protein